MVNLVVSAQRKAEILRASYEAGAVIKDVARLYGVETKTLVGWRHKEKRRNAGRGRFVEVAVQEPFSPVLPVKIKSASISFGHCRVNIEGEISQECVLEVMKLVGSSC